MTPIYGTGTKPPPFIDMKTYKQQINWCKETQGRPGTFTPSNRSAISIEPAGGWVNRARIRGGAR